jgi:hypothetical protein
VIYGQGCGAILKEFAVLFGFFLFAVFFTFSVSKETALDFGPW